ncbi:hypothetical protein OAD49_01635 [Flavobacteriaceae bacterium]|jgi:hypothetical protein|uniref:hypothetical protein n=1 Tax=Formosa sp. Hel1_33_131 TaxID=1336794 RepID=UPI00084E296F|nr:hypothetical protein [Formosa sp. Hel1_33_131]AOR29330.1 hypothetical protein FORMB_23120 [Formosa sp. Hel1_33_131]MDB9954242.1 hypothetical protein [Flavobacteriaceae bacterium]
MKTTDLNTALLDNYFGLIKNLSPEIKINLIEKIAKTLKGNVTSSNSSLTDAFGAWKSKKSADEILIELRDHRNFDRQIEAL